MTTRREFLVGTTGVAGGLALSGCSRLFESESDDPSPGTGLLGGVADPSEQVQPEFFTGYHFQIAELTRTVDLATVTPGVGGNLIPEIEQNISAVSLDDIEAFTGSRVRSQGIAGGGLAFSVPSGQSLVVNGEFGTDPFADWLSSVGADSLGEQDGYQRYAVTREQTSGFEAFAVTEGTFIAVVRSDIGFGPEEGLAAEIEHRESGESSLADSAPAYASVAEELDDSAMQRAAGYALIPLGADTGTAEFDDVVSGITGSGLSISPGAETEVQRTVSYLDAEMASESTLVEAFVTSENDDLGDAEWSTSTNGAVVNARTTTEQSLQTAMFQSALPITGYQNAWNPINPTNLGRDSPPIVYFQPSVSDDSGVLELEQIGGSEVENLLVRYIHDGSERRESWEGPVGEGDQFESEESIDSGTQAWIVWRPDTIDAAVISRFRTPS